MARTCPLDERVGGGRIPRTGGAPGGPGVELIGGVPVSTFVTFLALGAGALALWIEVRFPRLAPADWRRVFAHLLASTLVIQFPMVSVMHLLLHYDIRGTFVLAAVGIALPGITYLFLSSLWLLRLAQRLLPGVR